MSLSSWTLKKNLRAFSILSFVSKIKLCYSWVKYSNFELEKSVVIYSIIDNYVI